MIEDEYKDTTDGKDASSDAKIKTKQSKMSNGVSIRRRFHRDLKKDRPTVETSIGIERTFTWTGTNAPQQIPQAIQNRATIIPVVLPNSRLHRDKIVDNMVGGVATAIHNNAKVQVNLKACQLSSKVLSSLQIHYTGLEAIGGIPRMIEDTFEVFKLLHVQRFGKGKKAAPKDGDGNAESSRQTGEHLRLATAIHIRDHLAIWYCRGLGAHFDYDKSIENLWYAWSNYLRMEEVILAMIQLTSTRSMSGYIEEVMVLLKESIMVSDGEMMEVGDYWVTKYTRRSAVMRDLRSRLIRFGPGLCERVYELVEHSKTGESPNIKLEMIADRHSEYLMVHKQWIAMIVTPVEAAIITVLRRVVSQGIVAYKEYEDEEYHVLETQIRKSLRNPRSDGAVQHEDLAKFAPEVIQNGFRQMENRYHEGDPMVKLPQDAKYAVYTATQVDGAVRAKDGIRWKRSKNVYAPLLIHKKLLYPDDVQPESAIDGFFKEMLLISGGYLGRRIFSGMDPANPSPSVTSNFIMVRPGDTTKHRLKNPHRISKATTNIIFGDDFSDDSDDEEEGATRTLFPPDKDVLEFDEHSAIERIVADAAHARVPLDPAVEAVFATAYRTYR